MRKNGNCNLRMGSLLIGLFAVWTLLVRTVDVQIAGETGRAVGFASLNGWLHRQMGVHMAIYTITDWLGLVPVFVCLVFGTLGFAQMIQRRSLWKVDLDILLLGVYYILVIVGYLMFERIPINYRPVFVEGRLEVSYPSSTTLLVLSVMPTLAFQVKRRFKNVKGKHLIRILVILFSAGMVLGRLISGVHWFTDIVGSVLLSVGLFEFYKGMVLLFCRKEK